MNDFTPGARCAVTGWGYTADAVVAAVRAGEVDVEHRARGLLTFTLRVSGAWVLKGFRGGPNVVARQTPSLS